MEESEAFMGRSSNGLLVLLLPLLLFATGCLEEIIGTGNGESIVYPPSANVVCNPFGDDPSDSGHGLQARLAYLDDSQPRYSSVIDYINYGNPVEANLFFNMLDIPTRPFDRGFVTYGGKTIMNQNGNTLYEYFSLHFESGLALDVGDPLGDYQLAVLSDDGAIIQVNDTMAGYRTIINNDGNHPTQFGCATTPVRMMGDAAPIPIKISYHQGPRYHIALTLMWRPWPTEHPVNDPECGQLGNSRYFDSTQNPPTPQPAYNGLLARGWKVLKAKNYVLSSLYGEGFNPCATGAPITISNVRVLNLTRDSATITWDTDRLSDSQVAYTLFPSTTYVMSALDQNPTQNHTITLTGLTPNGFYSFYAVSKTPGGQQATSNVTSFRTMR